MQEIVNYYQVTDKIATSGQPTREQFQEIAGAGYDAIINLALPSSKNAIADEGAIVTGLDMAYFQIPVLWEAPKIEDVKLFFGVMNSLSDKPPASLRDRKVWVHCALNMRVSCFMYLFQKHVLHLPEERSLYPMERIWQPEGVWQQLIQDIERDLI